MHITYYLVIWSLIHGFSHLETYLGPLSDPYIIDTLTIRIVLDTLNAPPLPPLRLRPQYHDGVGTLSVIIH